MRRAQHPVYECIGKALNSQYDAIVQEALPQRWVDLIRRLSDRERGRLRMSKPRKARDREP